MQFANQSTIRPTMPIAYRSKVAQVIPATGPDQPPAPLCMPEKRHCDEYSMPSRFGLHADPGGQAGALGSANNDSARVDQLVFAHGTCDGDWTYS